MLASLMTKLIDEVKLLEFYKQIEPYEGQFEDIDQYTIASSACFIEFSAGRADDALGKKTIITVDMYLVENHKKSKINVLMLDRVEQIKELLHDKCIGGMGYTFFRSWNREGIMPGLIVYHVVFEFKENL